MTAQVSIICIYVVMMVTIGVKTRRYSNSLKSFMLGGREAGAWMSAFGYGTTYFGLWASLVGIGNAVLGTLLAWKVIAGRTRAMTHKHKLGTLAEFFNMRYLDSNMKIFAAVIIFVFMTPYAASVFSGLSYFFESVFHIDYFWAIFLMAGVSAVYLVLGGYVAALVADFVQGIIMFAGVVIMIAAIFSTASIGGFAKGMQSRMGQAAAVPLADFSQPNNWGTLISLILLTSFGTWGLPQMLHKFFAIKDEAAVKRGTIISTVFCLVVGGGAYFTGGLEKLYYTVNPDLVPMNGTAIAFDRLMPDFLTHALPAGLLGLVIVLVLSASVTTLTGITLVSSSSFTVDIVRRIKPELTKQQALLTTRVMCAVFIVISVVIALTKSPIQALMSFSWGTISGCFIGPLLLGIYWKGTTKAGAWAGMLGGFIISMGATVITGFNAGNAPVIGAAAMAGSVLLTWLVSLFTPKFTEEHVADVFDF